MNEEKTKRLAKVAVVYASIVWGTTFFIVKDTVSRLDPLAMLTYRFAIAAVVSALIIKWRGHKLFEGFRGGATLGFFLWLAFITQSYGIRITSASSSGFITGLYVPLVPIMAIPLLRKWPTFSQGLAVVVSVIGLWVLTGGIHAVNLGDGLTVATAVAVAFQILFSEKYIRQNRDPLVLSFQQFLVVCVLSAIWIPIFHLPLAVGGERAALSIVYLAIFGSITCIAAQTFAQKHLEAVSVAIIFTLEPVFAAIFAWTLGGEPFEMKRALGGLIIVAAMLIAEIKFR